SEKPAGGVCGRHQRHARADCPPVRHPGHARLRLPGAARPQRPGRLALPRGKNRAALAAAGRRTAGRRAALYPRRGPAPGAAGAGTVIAAGLLQPLSLWLGWACYALILLWAAWRTPWVELFSDQRRQHLLFGTALALFLLWLVRRDFASGLSFHFIGMTAVTLLLDWPLALLCGFAAQLGLLAFGRVDPAALGVNGLLLVAIPV